MIMESTYLYVMYLSLLYQVKAGNPLMQLVAVDWFQSNQRVDHIAARDGCIIQKLFARQVLNYSLMSHSLLNI